MSEILQLTRTKLTFVRLYLVRHARTKNNLSQLTQGWADTELDEIGRRQADAVAAYFETKEVGSILSSDLLRAVHTAQPTANLKELEIQTTELLRERSLGELENAPIQQLRDAFEEEIERTGESRYKVRPKGVESAYDVMARVIEFTRLIPSDQGDVAIFTHGMTKEVLLCHLIGCPVESSRSFCFDNASITSLRRDDDVWVIETYNDTRHLTHIATV
jgi:probable phosphoglycerate mutase